MAHLKCIYIHFVLFSDINTSGYFLLNSSSIITKELLSPIGLRFSIKSLNIKIELQSLTKNLIQLRYKTRTSIVRNDNPRKYKTNIN